MIAGLGTDMIDVERIAEKIGKESGFRELVFSATEIEYCESKANPFEHYAARFAAKEAFFKALGTGWLSGTAFNEVIVINDNQGKPGLIFTGETAAIIEAMKFNKILLSLTHLKSIASAVVIIEQ
ncbi:holo-[acyl-carrier-protein] synthase [soil metagenome]